MNTKKIHLQSKCTIQVERKKEKRHCKLFTEISQQQVNQMARTAADQYQSCINSWSFVYDVMELSNICFVLVFECGRPGLQSSTLPLSVHPSRGGRPWIELSENDKSVPLGPVFSTEYAKPNANQQLSEIIEQVS